MSLLERDRRSGGPRVTGGVPRNEATARDFMMVRAVLIRRLGSANNAVIWTRVDYRCATSGDGWYRVSHNDLAEETGLTANMVRTSLSVLVNEGFLEVDERNDGNAYDHTKSYRPIWAETQIEEEHSPEQDAGHSPDLSSSKTSKTLSTSRRSRVGGSKRPTKFTPRQPDDDLSPVDEDESPALGADTTRKSATAARSTSPRVPNTMMLARRVAEGLRRDGVVIATNEGAIRSNLAADRRAGLDPALQVAMVDRFLANRAQYTFSDRIPPWQTFLAQRTAIAEDCRRIQVATNSITPDAQTQEIYEKWQAEVLALEGKTS